MPDIRTEYGIDSSQMNGSVHHRPTFCLPASAFRLHIKVISLLKMLPKITSLTTFFITDPVDCGIKTHSIFADIELSHNTKKKKNKWQLQLRCVPGKMPQQHFPGLWPK